MGCLDQTQSISSCQPQNAHSQAVTDNVEFDNANQLPINLKRKIFILLCTRTHDAADLKTHQIAHAELHGRHLQHERARHVIGPS